MKLHTYKVYAQLPPLRRNYPGGFEWCANLQVAGYVEAPDPEVALDNAKRKGLGGPHPICEGPGTEKVEEESWNYRR